VDTWEKGRVDTWEKGRVDTWEKGRVDTWEKGRVALERNHMENKCCGLHAEDSVRDERVVVVSVQSCESVVDIAMLSLISTHSFYHVA